VLHRASPEQPAGKQKRRASASPRDVLELLKAPVRLFEPLPVGCQCAAAGRERTFMYFHELIARGFISRTEDYGPVLSILERLAPSTNPGVEFAELERLYRIPSALNTNRHLRFSQPEVVVRFNLLPENEAPEPAAQVDLYVRTVQRNEGTVRARRFCRTTLPPVDALCFVEGFLPEATFAFERVRRGNRFCFRDGTVMDVFRLERVCSDSKGNFHSELLSELKWIVELRCLRSLNALGSEISAEPQCSISDMLGKRLSLLAPYVVQV
jgi:hypothetical protein